MNLEFYRIIGDTLSGGINTAYKAGLASIVRLNKREILRLADDPEMFKINYTGTDNAMLMNFKVEAFTVAGVMSYELEEKLKQLALDLQDGKHPLAKGETDIKKVWSDEAQNILADYIPVSDMPPPSYLNTNLRTAMQSSYHAAEWNRLQDDSVRDLYPAYQYKTLADARVREEHRKLHDKIWSNNDEIWNHIWPPNGWNCRCYVKPLTLDEKNNSSVEPLTSSKEASQEIMREGKIGKDFDRNPGQIGSIWGKWLQSKLSGKNYDDISNSLIEAGYSIPKWELLKKQLDVNKSEYRDLEFNDENYNKDFPKGTINTPMGEFKLGDGFKKKIIENERQKEFGLIKPTLADPELIIVDKENATVFIKSFKKGREVNYIGVLKNKNDVEMVISAGERRIEQIEGLVKNGKLLIYHATALESPAQDSPKQFAFDSGRFNYSKVNFSLDIKNIKITPGATNESQISDVLKDANEIWGEIIYNRNGVVKTEVNFIRYRVDGFQLTKVNNNEAYGMKFYGYDKIDEYRKGVIFNG